MAKRTRKVPPVIEKGSEGSLGFTENLKTVLVALPKEERSDALVVFDRLAARLPASVERTRKIQRGLKLGWSLQELSRSTDSQLDVLIARGTPGCRKGLPVDGAILRGIRLQLKKT